MHANGLTEALAKIVVEDPRYDREAYLFLRDALDFTIKLKKKRKTDVAMPHVSGVELLEGVRKFSLKQFGPMVVTVFNYWGIKKCEDFGHMVFNLVGAGVFGKTETDSIEDFKGVFSFQEAFIEPFLPAAIATNPTGDAGQPASELQ